MVAVATYPIMVDKTLLQISPDKLQEKSHFYGACINFKMIVIKIVGQAELLEKTKGLTRTNFSLVS